LVASASRDTPAAVAASAPVADKNSPRNEPAAAAVNRTQVADLGTSAVGQDQNASTPGNMTAGKRWTLSTPAPLPPPRPPLAGDFALAFADAPVPPARPVSLTRVAALAPVKGPDKMQGKDGALASKSNAPTGIAASDAAAAGMNGPLARAANLPVVITQGPKDRVGVPNQVLAFASDTPVQNPVAVAVTSSKTPGQTVNRSATQPPVATARLERAKSRGLASDIATASFPAPSILAPSFTGLRRAARIIPDALSNMPSVDYVSAFGASTAPGLDTGHFTGSTAKPVALAQGLVSAGEGPATPPKN
jgi:hypothetical protein